MLSHSIENKTRKPNFRKNQDVSHGVSKVYETKLRTDTQIFKEICPSISITMEKEIEEVRNILCQIQTSSKNPKLYQEPRSDPSTSEKEQSSHVYQRRVIFPWIKNETESRKNASLFSILRRSNTLIPSRSVLPRSISAKIHKQQVKFDPRVWVHKISGDENRYFDEKWFSNSDLKRFKRDAIEHIQRQYKDAKSTMKVEKDVNFVYENSAYFSLAIRNILVIDSHQIYLLLSKNAIKKMLPYAEVTIARSNEKAFHLIEKERMKCSVTDTRPTHGFDLIIVDERLQTTSNNNGFQFIQQISSEQKKIKEASTSLFGCVECVQHPRYSFLIGVSANIKRDHKQFKISGADMVWEKPLPSTNSKLKSLLVKAVNDKQKQFVKS